MGLCGPSSHLAVEDHGSHHAFRQLERRQLLFGDLPLALPHFPRTLNVLEEAWERRVALVLIQAVVVRIAPVREDPSLVLVRSCIDHNRLARGAVETGVAGEGRAVLALASPSRKHFLHQRGKRGILGASAVNDGAEEKEDERAAPDEEIGKNIENAATPSQQHVGDVSSTR